MVWKILRPFYVSYVIVTFVASVILAFPLFVLASIGNKASGRKVIYSIIRWWARLWLIAIGMRLDVSGAAVAEGRYVVVANHKSYLDTILLFPGVPCYFRALGKIEISRVPVLGFIYRQIVIMVDRGSTLSRVRSMKIMYRVLRNESSIVIFPEGTFNETDALLKDFYNGAFRLAINAQVPILPIVFPDTVFRWHYSAWWKLSPGKNRAIVLPVVPVAGLTLSDLPRLKLQIRQAMEAELAKYPNKGQPSCHI